MSRHLLVIAAILGAILFLSLRKTDMDRLMVPAENYAESQAGSRFVEPGPGRVDPRGFTEHGVTTVVYFHDKTCAGCKELDRDLAALLRVRPDVAVRKIAIQVGSDGYSEAIAKYRTRIYMTPFILLFDKNGKLVAADDRTDGAGYDLLTAWIRRELTAAQQRGA